MLNRTTRLLIALFILSTPVFALHSSTLDLNLPGANIPENLEFILSHRFLGNAFKNPLDDFMGADDGANTTIGFGFRARENMGVTFLRSSLDKEYYAAGKFTLSDELSILLGLTAKTTPLNIQDRTSFIGQIIYRKEIRKDNLYFSVVPTFVNPYPSSPTISMGLAFGYLPMDYFEIIAEFIPILSGYSLKYPNASLGFKMQTWGHYFTLLLTNSVRDLPTGYGIGTNDNYLHLGFSIIRKF